MGNERVSGEKPRQLVAVEIDDFEPAFPLPNQDESETLRRHSIVFKLEGDNGLQGGTGRVLHVWNACGDAMALKQPLLDLAGSEREARGRRDAFYEEYATQLTLSHLRGFPDLYGYGTVEGKPAILMEWVVGQTLESARDTLETEPSPDGPRVPARTVAALGVAVLDVLAAAGSLDRGLVHRDLSPKNIMLRTSRLDVREQARREDFDVCLIDFGSSALLGRAAGGTFTQRTNVWRNGTPEYAPPEMLTSDLAGAEELRRDPSIDVYTLCSVLYELYSGHTPYRLNEREVSSNYLAKHDRPPAPPRVRRSEDVPLVSAILSGIKPVQADRIDAARLRELLAAWLDGRAAAAPAPASGPEPARGGVTRRALLVGAGAVAATAACAAAAYGAFTLLGSLRGHDLADQDAPSGQGDNPEPSPAGSAPDGDDAGDAASAASPDGPLLPARDAATGFWGLVDETGAWALSPALAEAPGPLREELARALDPKTGFWGYVGRDGAWAIPSSFSAAGDFSGGLAPACDAATGLWGFIGEDGSWRVSPAFSEARAFSAGLAACEQPEAQADAQRARYGQLWGYVDQTGAWALAPQFAGAGDFSDEGLAPVARTASSWEFVDRSGETAVPGTWSRAGSFSGGLAPVMRGSTKRWGYVDTGGDLALDAVFDDALPFSGGLAPALDHDSGLWGLVNTAGSWVVAPAFSQLGSITDGVAPARDAGTGLCGLVDASGAWVVPATFADLSFA